MPPATAQNAPHLRRIDTAPSRFERVRERSASLSGSAAGFLSKEKSDVPTAIGAPYAFRSTHEFNEGIGHPMVGAFNDLQEIQLRCSFYLKADRATAPTATRS